MIVTEEEAKTKRCQESFGDSNVTPEGQTYVGGGAFGAMGGAFGIATSPSMCIGSRCMAWRWHSVTNNRSVGFCGKAGVPQERA